MFMSATGTTPETDRGTVCACLSVSKPDLSPFQSMEASLLTSVCPRPIPEMGYKKDKSSSQILKPALENAKQVHPGT